MSGYLFCIFLCRNAWIFFYVHDLARIRVKKKMCMVAKDNDARLIRMNDNNLRPLHVFSILLTLYTNRIDARNPFTLLHRAPLHYITGQLLSLMRAYVNSVLSP